MKKFVRRTYAAAAGALVFLWCCLPLMEVSAQTDESMILQEYDFATPSFVILSETDQGEVQESVVELNAGEETQDITLLPWDEETGEPGEKTGIPADAGMESLVGIRLMEMPLFAAAPKVYDTSYTGYCSCSMDSEGTVTISWSYTGARCQAVSISTRPELDNTRCQRKYPWVTKFYESAKVECPVGSASAETIYHPDTGKYTTEGTWILTREDLMTPFSGFRDLGTVTLQNELKKGILYLGIGFGYTNYEESEFFYPLNITEEPEFLSEYVVSVTGTVHHIRKFVTETEDYLCAPGTVIAPKTYVGYISPASQKAATGGDIYFNYTPVTYFIRLEQQRMSLKYDEALQLPHDCERKGYDLRCYKVISTG